MKSSIKAMTIPGVSYTMYINQPRIIDAVMNSLQPTNDKKNAISRNVLTFISYNYDEFIIVCQ